MTSQYAKQVVVGVAVLGFLGLASYVTTSVIWDGGFPAGEFRIKVQNADRQPIQGAVLRVYEGGTRNAAYTYPLDNHLAEDDLVSDATGRITAIRTNDGLQFGGHAWRLFWVIPMGAKAPEYDCVITAEGYNPLVCSIDRLFESPHSGRGYENFRARSRPGLASSWPAV